MGGENAFLFPKIIFNQHKVLLSGEILMAYISNSMFEVVFFGFFIFSHKNCFLPSGYFSFNKHSFKISKVLFPIHLIFEWKKSERGQLPCQVDQFCHLITHATNASRLYCRSNDNHNSKHFHFPKSIELEKVSMKLRK